LKRTIKRAGSLALLASVIILALGLLRYGGPEGLLRRAQSEISGYLPHPEYVPTPSAAGNTGAYEFTSAAATLDVVSPAETEPVREAPGAAIEPAPEAARDEIGQEPEPTAAIASSPLFRARTTGDAIVDRRVYVTVAQAGEPPEVTAGDAESLRSRKPTPTVVPPTATPAPTATRPPTATPAPRLPPTRQLEGLTHYWQTWNNCGPATLAMNLSYFGVNHGQDKVALVLRPYRDDKNVNPWEMVDYARSQGLYALARVNGDAERLRALVNAGVPVLIETWYEPAPNDGMGHYRLVVGYDDATQEWVAYDSYDSHGISKGQPYAGIRLAYGKLDELWSVFNRTYVVLYDEARAAAVESIIGADMDDAAMWQRSLAAAEAAIQANEANPFSWFNAGSSLVALGDYPRAAQAYDQARHIKLPWRMLWYQFGPFQAYYDTGRYDEIIALADATLKQAKSVEELFYWRGRALHAKGDIEAARAAFRQALEFNHGYADAANALAALP
jgi:tetratricopeptide (TPR) repeat protein